MTLIPVSRATARQQARYQAVRATVTSPQAPGWRLGTPRTAWRGPVLLGAVGAGVALFILSSPLLCGVALVAGGVYAGHRFLRRS